MHAFPTVRNDNASRLYFMLAFVVWLKKLIKTIWMGLSAVDPCRYEVPSKHGFANDNERLRGDVQTFGNDVKKAIDKYGQRPHKYSR